SSGRSSSVKLSARRRALNFDRPKKIASAPAATAARAQSQFPAGESSSGVVSVAGMGGLNHGSAGKNRRESRFFHYKTVGRDGPSRPPFVILRNFRPDRWFMFLQPTFPCSRKLTTPGLHSKPPTC